MASQSNRYQERLAARQRGAGTHKVTNVGFTISLNPPPPQPPPAAAQAPPLPLDGAPQVDTAPAPALAPRRSGRITPNVSPLPVLPAAKATPARATPPSSLRNEVAARRTSARTSTGLSTAAAAAPDIPDAPNDTPVNSISARDSTRANSVTRGAVAAVTPVARGKRTRQPSPNKFLTTPEAEEITRAHVNVNGKSRSKSRSSRDRSVSVNGTKVDGVVARETPENRRKKRKVVVEKEVQKVQPGLEAEQNKEAVEDMVEQAQPEPQPEPVTEEHAESTGPTLRPPRRKLQREGKKPPPPPIIPEEEEEAAAAERAIAATLEGTHIDDESSVREEHEAEEEETEEEQEVPEADGEDLEPSDEEYEPEGKEASPPEVRPLPKAKQKQKPSASSAAKPRTQPRARQKAALAEPTDAAEEEEVEEGEDEAVEGAAPRRRRRREGGIPITVHRLSKSGGQALPPGSQRSGVNAVDVISQLFMEVIDKFYGKLSSNSEKRAVESFKEELGVRLMELTDALESNIALNARVRQTARKKAQLQTELLEVKKSRRRVAAKMDEVRANHEAAARDSNNQRLVTSAFEDISGVVERGRARQESVVPDEFGDSAAMDGLEALAMKVTDVVAGGDQDGTGLLNKVVEFNKFLERAEEQLRIANSKNSAGKG